MLLSYWIRPYQSIGWFVVLLLNNLGHESTVQAPNKHRPQVGFCSFSTKQAPYKHRPHLIFCSLCTVQPPNKHRTTISKRKTILSSSFYKNYYLTVMYGACAVLVRCVFTVSYGANRLLCCILGRCRTYLLQSLSLLCSNHPYMD